MTAICPFMKKYRTVKRKKIEGRIRIEISLFFICRKVMVIYVEQKCAINIS